LSRGLALNFLPGGKNVIATPIAIGGSNLEATPGRRAFMPDTVGKVS